MAGSAEFVAQVTRVQRPLHAFILSLVWNPTDAEEVLQETNLTLWKRRTNLMPRGRFFLGDAVRPVAGDGVAEKAAAAAAGD